jgi:cytidylate kinase
MSLRIAIDGPASSGKGTVARLVARHLGYAYVDTGAMYRAVALFARRRGVSWDDAAGLSALTLSLTFAFSWRRERLVVSVCGEDVSLAIREPEIGQGASRVSVHPGVRAALLSVQQGLARTGGVVMEGRDIGTVVLPNAELKVYLDAEVAVRAHRRAAELRRRGEPVLLAEIASELQQRDARDRGRAVAPLKQAADAVYLDTTAMDAVSATAEIVRLALLRS